VRKFSSILDRIMGIPAVGAARQQNDIRVGLLKGGNIRICQFVGKTLCELGSRRMSGDTGHLRRDFRYDTHGGDCEAAFG